MIYNDFIFEICNYEIKIGCERLKSNTITNKSDKNIDKDYPIHNLAFNNNWNNFIDYFLDNKSIVDINCQDKLGNTPLHIASLNGHKEFIYLLTFLNADASIKNKEGWSAIQESISFGNIDIVSTLARLYKVQNNRRIIEVNKNVLTKEQNREFILDFTWDVKTWVPIVSKYLPSDKCKLIKSGRKLRFDSTLVDFSDQKWCRGNLSCIINPEISTGENPNQIFLLNNDRKIYQILREFDEKDFKREVYFMMTSDIVDLNLDLDRVSYTPRSKFWWFNKDPIIEKIGNYEAKMYDMNNVKISVKRRREHISKEQVDYNRAISNKLQQGKMDILKSMEMKLYDVQPPPLSTINWDEYKESMVSCTPVVLGRKQVIKTSIKTLDFSIGMSKSFPLDISEILDILEMILPIKKISRLRDICSTNLPPGFPVTIDIPVFPTVSANISFLSAQVENLDSKIEHNMFIIPDNYKMVLDIGSSTHA